MAKFNREDDRDDQPRRDTDRSGMAVGGVLLFLLLAGGGAVWLYSARSASRNAVEMEMREADAARAAEEAGAAGK